MDNPKERKWSGKSRGGRFGHLFFVFLIRHLGLTSAYVFLSLVVVYFIPCAPRATAAIWRYNRRRLGHGRLRSVAELYLHYYVFGQTIIDKVAMQSGLGDRFTFEFENYERFLSIIDGPSGAVLIGAHAGCWQTGVGFFGQYGKKINIVMFDTEYEQIKEVVENSAREADYKIIPVNKGSLDAVLQIKVALNRGEYVCFQGDRYVDRESAVEAEFLGAQARFPKGPFLVASKFGVPVVFYSAMRERGRKYRFLFTDIPAAESSDAGTLLKRYTSTLETLLGRYPRQWFNFYDFWGN